MENTISEKTAQKWPVDTPSQPNGALPEGYPAGQTCPTPTRDANGSTRAYEDSKLRNSGPTTPLTGARLWILFTAVFFATFLMALNASIVSTAIPKITTHFNSLDDIGWYGSATLISTCAMQPLTGKLYTLFPIKQTYIVFVSIFFLGCVLCGAATSSEMLIGGRAVQGMGGAGMLNGAFTTIAAAAPKEYKPMFVGVGIGASTVGSVIGPLIGGALTESVTWRWCFYISLPPAGLILLIFLYLHIPEQIEKKTVIPNLKAIITNELDLIGFVLFATACVMALLALTWGGNTYRWDSATIIGLFCGAFGTTVVFAAWEVRRGDKAMMPPTVVRNRLVIFGCLTSWCQAGAMFTLTYYLPLWFQVIKNASPLMSGVMILPTAISQSAGAVAAGKFVQLIGYVTPWALFGSMVSSIGSGLMTTFTPSTGAGPWIGYQILIGVGRAPVLQMPITAVQNLLPPAEVAIATSQIFFFQYMGGAVMVAVAQTIFTNGLRSSMRTYASPDVDVGVVIGAGASAVRSTVSHADLPGVLRAYNQAIVDTFYLAMAGSCAAFLTSFGLGWQKLPSQGGKKTEKDEEKNQEKEVATGERE
ncbi:hypothetical protein HRR83_002686 [Exophiala dermatitidis]|nr:hypothetical protein HRR76_005463 [Exophiala dermatitidis]KAJ4542226.1 hypothetical protein HRR78_006926 [Exophiala dermatitidis]KAJ4569607.1 hypothetical protein HRR79_004448 [Exophiala dermatitidis]KAJ4583236.1 hypothetical protein HRR82_003543 [Exophiala dermatitidis]KAJ4601488.1 hypothetical protein HRR83_002686 [Exophiala dermatitidis]